MKYSDGGRMVGRLTFPYRFYRVRLLYKFFGWVWRVTGINERARRDLKKWIATYAPEGQSKCKSSI